MTRTIAICSQKGGISKTTTAAHLAVAWGQQGRRVLLVDLDPQFALTRRFKVDPSQVPTLVSVVAGEPGSEPIELVDAIVEQVAEGVDLVPADRRMHSLELSLTTELKRETVLRRALAGNVDPYDVVIVDCPPNLGLLTVNALCAADHALIPVNMQSVDSLMGAHEAIATVRTLADSGEAIRELPLLRVCCDSRRIAHQAIDEAIEQQGLAVLDTCIPQRAEFERSELEQRPVSILSPSSSGTRAYRDLALELNELVIRNEELVHG